MILIDGYILAWEVIQGGQYVVAGILIAILTAVWLMVAGLLKMVVWNVVFPEIRLADPMGNKPTVGRRYWPIVARDKTEWTMKFSLFPIFQFFTLNVEGRKTNRFPPWAININGKDIMWDENEANWYVTDINRKVQKEDIKEYDKHVAQLLRRVATDVAQGVKGDQGLQKRKYRLGIPNPLADIEAFEESGEEVPEECKFCPECGYPMTPRIAVDGNGDEYVEWECDQCSNRHG